MQFPLLVQFAFYPASAKAAAMGEHLRAVIDDAAPVPCLRMPTLYQQRGEAWDEYDTIADERKTRSLAGLQNGMTDDQRRELATTRSAERIGELVLRGIQQSNPPAAAASDAE